MGSVKTFAEIRPRQTPYPGASRTALTVLAAVLAALAGVPAPSPRAFAALAAPTMPHFPMNHSDPVISVDFTPVSGRLGIADIRLHALPGALASARATIRRTDLPSEARDETLRSIDQDPHVESTVWSARVMLANEANASDVRCDVNITATLPSGDVITRGPLHFSTAPGAAVASPDWAKGAVWYQVFPERFRNGNPRNDPRDADTCLLPWTADWSAVAPEEAEAARAHADPAARPPRTGAPGSLLSRVVTRRRYGGDLQGLAAKLDDLHDLGVTALYLTPVFQARSLHKYDASDFRHVDATLADPDAPAQPWNPDPTETLDPATWKWTPADRYVLDTLLPETRRRAMHLIFDGVWNHTGTDFWAFRDIRARGSASPYAEWYQVAFTSPDSTTGAPGGKLLSWQSWNGTNGSLPKFRHTDDGADLAPAVKSHIFHITRRWMTPDSRATDFAGSEAKSVPSAGGDPAANVHSGIDGWRLDVAAEVPMGFWSSWRAHVKHLNPDALLVGELWGSGADYFKGRAFDAQMNYPFARAVVDWLRAFPGAESSDTLAAALTRAFDLDPQTALVQFNLLSSHDTQRLLSALANPAFPYVSGGSPEDLAKGYDRSRPDRGCFDLALVGMAIQAAYLGAPMIYYGEEWAMHGAKDPDCRKPLPWPDLGPPDNPADAPDPAFREAAAAWFRLRSNPQFAPVLRYGDVRHIPTSHTRVFAFERSLNSDSFILIANASDSPFDAIPLIPASAKAVVPPNADRTAVPPRSAAAYFIRR